MRPKEQIPGSHVYRFQGRSGSGTATLEKRVTGTLLVELHTEIAEVMLPCAIALFLVRIAQ